VLIGKDTRISGYMFESALEAGLVASGTDIRLLGPMPTPGVAYLTRTFRAEAGIVITASHNPYRRQRHQVLLRGWRQAAGCRGGRDRGRVGPPFKTVPAAVWARSSVSTTPPVATSNSAKAAFRNCDSLRGLKIVLDCAHGATYNIAPFVFEELGARVITIGAAPDGFNINRDVGSTKPEALAQRVLDEGADLGIAFDGDGDRLMMVDASGQMSTATP
jgi:phosphoglucosamine mutase